MQKISRVADHAAAQLVHITGFTFSEFQTVVRLCAWNKSNPTTMFALTAPVASAAIVSLPVALKAVGEVHRHVLASDALARQGLGPVGPAGASEKLARKRTAGIPGGLADQEPGYLSRVPGRGVAGDTRKDYEVGGLGNATSSQGLLQDILAKVPRKTHGSGDYKRINRPAPSRLPGFDNQMHGP